MNPSILLSRWWTSPKTLSPSNAGINSVVGLVSIGLAVLDIRLGLGTYGRWLLGVVFGAIPLLWGLLAWRLGNDPKTARPLRLAGDIALWSGLVFFTALALIVPDAPESGPLITVMIFVFGTIIGAVINVRKDAHPRS